MPSSTLGRSAWLGCALSVGLALGASPGSVRAQNILDQKGAAEIRTQFLADLDTVRAKIMALAETIPEGKYETADLTPLLGKREMFGRSFTFPELVLSMSGDLHEHLGQLVTYNRSIGEVPPWSKKRS